MMQVFGANSSGAASRTAARVTRPVTTFLRAPVASRHGVAATAFQAQLKAARGASFRQSGVVASAATADAEAETFTYQAEVSSGGAWRRLG